MKKKEQFMKNTQRMYQKNNQPSKISKKYQIISNYEYIQGLPKRKAV